MLGTVLNFAAALAGLIAAWRWYKTTTIRPPTELPYGSPTTIDTGPLVAFIKEIARLNSALRLGPRLLPCWRAWRPSPITMDDEPNEEGRTRLDHSQRKFHFRFSWKSEPRE
jgi:hypothetical protein